MVAGSRPLAAPDNLMDGAPEEKGNGSKGEGARKGRRRSREEGGQCGRKRKKKGARGDGRKCRAKVIYRDKKMKRREPGQYKKRQRPISLH